MLWKIADLKGPRVRDDIRKASGSKELVVFSNRQVCIGQRTEGSPHPRSKTAFWFSLRQDRRTVDELTIAEQALKRLLEECWQVCKPLECGDAYDRSEGARHEAAVAVSEAILKVVSSIEARRAFDLFRSEVDTGHSAARIEPSQLICQRTCTAAKVQQRARRESEVSQPGFDKRRISIDSARRSAGRKEFADPHTLVGLHLEKYMGAVDRSTGGCARRAEVPAQAAP